MTSPAQRFLDSLDSFFLGLDTGGEARRTSPPTRAAEILACLREENVDPCGPGGAERSGGLAGMGGAKDERTRGL